MSRILFYLLCTLSKLNKINNQKIWILIFLVKKNFSLVKDFSHLQVSKKKTFSFSKWLQYFKIKVQLIDNWNCFWTFTQCLIVIWTVFAQLFLSCLNFKIHKKMFYYYFNKSEILSREVTKPLQVLIAEKKGKRKLSYYKYNKISLI